MVNFKNKIAGLKLTKENIHNLNIYIFLGLTLVHWIIGVLYYFYSSNKIRKIKSSYTTP